MPSQLLLAQQDFAMLLSEFLYWIHTSTPYKITFGDFDRPDGLGHMKNSLHYDRLAADINLFVDDVYIVGANTAWQALAQEWKSLNAKCQWGGDFASKDYNHFSYAYGGRE